ICFKLVDIVSKGGNYLLNVGPDAEGCIPQPSQDILRQVGAWLKVTGEAVYGAGPTAFGAEFGSFDPVRKDQRGRPVFHANTAWRCTTKPGKLYLHLFQWPGAKFELPGVKGTITKAYLLTDGQPLLFTQTEEAVRVRLPETVGASLDTVLCFEVQDTPAARPERN
ncbi:MAG: alpha-L-fucosidase, partial [Planctomycetes bacterium]|nr:alpha-L-fucosidase [Planctomycetota bacterium]